VPQQQRQKLTYQQQLYNLIPADLLQKLVPEPGPQKLVAVYRINQLSWDSPCFLGNPCPTCAPHKECYAGNPCNGCLRGKRYDCDRQTPAKPAFWATIRAALRMIEWRLAIFIHHNTALRLTDDETAHLRDLSCVIDDEVILQYLAQRFLARIAVDKGWGQRKKGTEVPRSEATTHRFHYR